MTTSTLMRKTSSIARWGNSQGVRIPKECLASVDISENDPLEIIVTGKAIVIKKAVQPKKTYEDLFKDFQGSYDMGEVDWGSPRGNEEW